MVTADIEDRDNATAFDHDAVCLWKIKPDIHQVLPTRGFCPQRPRFKRGRRVGIFAAPDSQPFTGKRSSSVLKYRTTEIEESIIIGQTGYAHADYPICHPGSDSPAPTVCGRPLV
jgi:hypothetical protein